MSAGRDDFKDSYYLRAMRTGIGSALRNQHDTDAPLPDRLAELLKELDDAENVAASRAACENAPSARPARFPPGVDPNRCINGDVGVLGKLKLSDHMPMQGPDHLRRERHRFLYSIGNRIISCMRYASMQCHEICSRKAACSAFERTFFFLGNSWPSSPVIFGDKAQSLGTLQSFASYRFGYSTLGGGTHASFRKVPQVRCRMPRYASVSAVTKEQG
jgi:hypothetical protein